MRSRGLRMMCGAMLFVPIPRSHAQDARLMPAVVLAGIVVIAAGLRVLFVAVAPRHRQRRHLSFGESLIGHVTRSPWLFDGSDGDKHSSKSNVHQRNTLGRLPSRADASPCRALTCLSYGLAVA